MGDKSGKISGGQRRRIAIARAIATKPSLLIVDEPTADLDSTSARDILALLERIAQGGTIVIAVLHSLEHAIANAHEMVMVER